MECCDSFEEPGSSVGIVVDEKKKSHNTSMEEKEEVEV
jgi:hypothetical protein